MPLILHPSIAELLDMTVEMYRIHSERIINLEYRSAGFTVDNLTQGSGPALCEPGERVLGPGGATNASGSRLSTCRKLPATASSYVYLDQ